MRIADENDLSAALVRLVAALVPLFAND